MADNKHISKPPKVHSDERAHRKLLAEAIWGILDGKLYCTGEVTLTADAVTTVVTDHRVGNESVILFMPLTENAASRFTETGRVWAFTSPTGSSGTYYWGGYYNFAPSHNDFSGSPTFGTANAAYGAHFFIVLGAVTVDVLTIRVTGTSFAEGGVRTAADTEDIVIPNSTPANTFYQTSKRWIGQITISVFSGTAKNCNYGWAAYWNNDYSDFTVIGCDFTWLGGANDADANLGIIHHKATGWTYNAGSTPTPPALLTSMQTDYNTEYQIKNGEFGAYKRTGLSTSVAGSNKEGIIVYVKTTANKAFELGNAVIRIKSQISPQPFVQTTDIDTLNHTFTVNHIDNDLTDRDFRYLIVG